MGRTWLRELSEVVIQGDFHGLVGAEAVRTSGHHSNRGVEALDGTVGDLSFGPKPVQDQRLMSTQQASHLLHRFQTPAPGPEAPIAEKAAGPARGFVLTELGAG